MSCTNPKLAWVSRSVGKGGRNMPTFVQSEALIGSPTMELPCGKCLTCIAVKQRSKGVQFFHESTMHSKNAFFTATFNPEHLERDLGIADGARIPSNDVLHPLMLDISQKFIKRLRKAIAPEKLRYFHVSERGEKGDRPHMHFAFFGKDFMEQSGRVTNHSFERLAIDGSTQFNQTYESPFLRDIWGKGNVEIGTLTIESCLYLAGYCMKKAGASKKEICRTQSSKPGLGRGWLDKYSEDIARTGKVVIQGKEMPIPASYLRAYADEFEDLINERSEYVRLQNRTVPKHIRETQAANKELNLAARLALKGSGRKL